MQLIIIYFLFIDKGYLFYILILILFFQLIIIIRINKIFKKMSCPNDCDCPKWHTVSGITLTCNDIVNGSYTSIVVICLLLYVYLIYKAYKKS